jgi:hypothetical protein
MKIMKKRKSKRAFVVGLMLFVSIFLVSSASASGDVCRTALDKCMTDALIAGLFSGPQTFLVYSSGCLIGYTWCLKYYVPEF